MGAFPDQASAEEQAEVFQHWNDTHDSNVDKMYDYKVKSDATGNWYVYYTFA